MVLDENTRIKNLIEKIRKLNESRSQFTAFEVIAMSQNGCS